MTLCNSKATHHLPHAESKRHHEISIERGHKEGHDAEHQESKPHERYGADGEDPRRGHAHTIEQQPEPRKHPREEMRGDAWGIRIDQCHRQHGTDQHGGPKTEQELPGRHTEPERTAVAHPSTHFREHGGATKRGTHHGGDHPHQEPAFRGSLAVRHRSSHQRRHANAHQPPTGNIGKRRRPLHGAPNVRQILNGSVMERGRVEPAGSHLRSIGELATTVKYFALQSRAGRTAGGALCPVHPYFPTPLLLSDSIP